MLIRERSNDHTSSGSSRFRLEQTERGQAMACVHVGRVSRKRLERFSSARSLQGCFSESLEQRVLLATTAAAPALLSAQLLADLNKKPESSSPAEFFFHNRVTYFAASDGDHGNELWKT